MKQKIEKKKERVLFLQKKLIAEQEKKLNNKRGCWRQKKN